MSDDGYHQAFVRLQGETGTWYVDPSLRGRLVAEAEKDGTSLTEVVTRILAELYNFRFESNGRKTAPALDAQILNLRLPMPLAQKIGARANAMVPRRTINDQIRADLSSHYSLGIPAKPRQTRRRGRSTAAA